MSAPDKLVRMANQIAANFSARGKDVAVAETLNHVVKFWDRRMKDQIRAHVATGGLGLTPIALAALKDLPAPAAPPS